MSANPPRILERSGSRIHYWLHGPEGRPLVAFTHGATADHAMFDAQVEALRDQYRVLTWDVRGHGRSKPIGDDFTIPDCAADLLALIEASGYRQAALVGQSMGGYISQELIFRHLDRVLAFVNIGSTPLTMRHTWWEVLSLRLSGPLLGLLPYGLLKRLTARSTAVTPEAQAYMRAAFDQVSPTEFQIIWRAVARALHPEPGYRIPCPVLITHGEHDFTGRIRAYARRWADRDADGHYVIIPNAGHNANQDNPAFFNPLLLDFLHRHLPPRV